MRENQKGLSRRDFLKGAAAGAFGIAAAGIIGTDNTWDSAKAVDASAPVTRSSLNISEEIDCDVVVVGGGASGVCSAVRAAENGFKVALLEKTSAVGGASSLSWAAVAYGSTLRNEAGEDVDLNPIIDEWVADSHWRVDASVIRQLLVESGAAFDWMGEHGWELTYMSGGFHILPDYGIRNDLWMNMIANTVEANGGVLKLSTTAKELETDSDGAVTAVIAEVEDGSGIRFNTKAVVIASGGYAGDAQMVLENFGFGGVLGGLPQNIGEGLKMAWEVGAKVPDNFGGQMLHQTLAKATDTLVQEFDPFPAKYPMILTYLPMMLNVGATGERFRNEALTLEAVPAAYSSATQGPFHYVVVSKQQIDTLIEEGLTGINMSSKPGMPPEFTPEYEMDSPWEDAYTVFDAMVEAGFGYKGDTPEELAENAGMEVDIFIETFKNYEAYCASGVDEQFNKAAEYLLSLGEEGPYYIVIAEINNLCSCGGLLTNAKYQVLDSDRKPIKGLYGVGNEAMSVLYNDTYVGSGIGMCNTITSGYLAGKYVSDFLEA